MQIDTKKIWQCVGIVLVMAAIVVVAVLSNRVEDNRICRHIDIRIEDQAERQYVSQNDIKVLLKSKDLFPIGRSMSDLSTQAIEEAVRSHSLIKTAECYLQDDSTVVVALSQRVPLLKVVTPTESYYIDTDRKVMPISRSVSTKVMVASGHIGERMAREEIADLVEWLNDNTYWQPRIVRIEVREGMQYVLYQPHPAPRILLGQISDYKNKLHKVRIFQEKAQYDLPEGVMYKELDARYENQIVGRK